MTLRVDNGDATVRCIAWLTPNREGNGDGAAARASPDEPSRYHGAPGPLEPGGRAVRSVLGSGAPGLGNRADRRRPRPRPADLAPRDRERALLRHLHAGRADGTFERRLQSYLRPHLLVIDDFGLKPPATFRTSRSVRHQQTELSI
ncbi:MAG: ATP-binding protein, partial [Chloroflexi bacterium]|nr:ATP-binding protein [Chloroflexota bacterium]